ncbi:MAG: aldo/keto reductase [Chloroflexota bacterium]
MATGETPRFLQAIELGVGAWQWGDKVIWNYGRGYTEADIRAAFDISISQGVTFIDTAEIYAMGKSERLVGRFIKTTEQPALVATKFFPFPWRFGRKSVVSALKRSLDRLGLDSVALYQVHWPPVMGSIETLMDGMADAVEMGLTRAVGVSNFDQTQMLAAYSALARRGLPLGSNQLEYHLLDRRIEKNGLLQRCKEMGVRVIAYSPLCQGLLAGKYTAKNPPPGLRARQYGPLLGKVGPLIKLMTEIGQDVGGRTPAQIAINWCICKGTLPIPGAKTAEQAEMNAGSTGWRLTREQIAALDEASDKINR